MAQKQITDNPPTQPQKIMKPPVITQNQTLPPVVPVPKPTKTEQQYKPIPPELKIILDALEEFEGIAYAARNKIYQLYGPVDYQIQNSTGKHRTLEDVRMSFPEEMEAKLDFIEQPDKIIIKSKMFLGTETFAKIASAVRGMGGQYISAGKDSHFEIKKV
jgi:hypothetical protein